LTVEVLPANFIKRIFRLYAIFRRDRDGVLFNYLTYTDFFGGFVARIAGLKLVVGGIETDRMFGRKFWAEYVSHKLFSNVTICNSHKAFTFFAARGFDKGRMLLLHWWIRVRIECSWGLAPRIRLRTSIHLM